MYSEQVSTIVTNDAVEWHSVRYIYILLKCHALKHLIRFFLNLVAQFFLGYITADGSSSYLMGYLKLKTI